MKRFHIALSVADVALSVLDYSKRLASDPVLIVDGEYALWRTDTLNVSIRKSTDAAGSVRHIGWEDDSTDSFQLEKDVNGIAWERFTAQQQADEIKQLWQGTQYTPA